MRDHFKAIDPPNLSRRRSQQRAALFSHPPPTVAWGWGTVDVGKSMLMSKMEGKGKETNTLWRISSSPHVVAGSGWRAIMKRGMR